VLQLGALKQMPLWDVDLPRAGDEQNKAGRASDSPAKAEGGRQKAEGRAENGEWRMAEALASGMS
jgi:hypothetical protein